ncbi:MAG: hypothetical protein N2376_02670 [Clostridia bacterium]|nr:hypothetical protein [Clostridia bacterium]
MRPYQDRPVESERIDILLKAAMAAPSACNTNTTVSDHAERMSILFFAPMILNAWPPLIQEEGLLIISFEKLMFLTVLAMDKTKYLNDLRCMRNRIAKINTLIHNFIRSIGGTGEYPQILWSIIAIHWLSLAEHF